MANRLLQVNFNHASVAQDLMMQVAAERDADLVVIAEPYRVPPRHSHWAVDSSGTSAITWRQTADSLPCTPLRAGTEFVVVRWGDIIVVGVYIPPGRGRTFFENRLERIGEAVREYASYPIIVAGDFNAYSGVWGSRRTDLRGRILEGWAASLGLHLLNVGSASTCMRPQGESVVDLTWATAPAAARVTGWRVVGELTDTDHCYIEMVLESSPAQVLRRRFPRPRRWVLRKMEEDKFVQTLYAGLWPAAAAEEEGTGGVKACAGRLRDLLIEACDSAMPRASPRPRWAVYWWSEEIASLRQSAHETRRTLKRTRRRRGTDPVVIDGLVGAHRGATRALRCAIARAIYIYIYISGSRHAKSGGCLVISVHRTNAVFTVCTGSKSSFRGTYHAAARWRKTDARCNRASRLAETGAARALSVENI